MSQPNNELGKSTSSTGSGSTQSGRGMNISTSDTNNAASSDGNGAFYATSSFPGLVVTAEEINFLVYRYLQESGFVHTAFTFAYESAIAKNACKNADVPPGALITFLQKGLQYLGIEENLSEDGSERKRKKRRHIQGTSNRNINGGNQHYSDDDSEPHSDLDKFSLLSPHACKALGRKNPPIRLNVPPATAAAVVTAKMAAEKAAQSSNKLPKNGDFSSKRKISNVTGNNDPNSQGVPSKNQYPQYQAQSSLSPARNNPPANKFNAAAAAAAMSQLHKQGKTVAPTIPTMGAVGTSFTGAHQVNLGTIPNATLPSANNTGSLNSGQPNGKASDNFIASLPSRNNVMVGGIPGYKPSAAKLSKNKPTAPIPGPVTQNNTTPKSNQGFPFSNQAPFPGTLDVGAGRIEVNAKNRDNISHHRVQSLMNAAAAGARTGTSTLNLGRAQNSVVGVDPNRNRQGATNLLQNVIANSALHVKNSGVIPHEVVRNLDTFRNPTVPGRQVYVNNAQPTPQLPVSSHNISQVIPAGDLITELNDTPTQILPSEIVELSKHTSEVFMCSWNQVHPHLIATGSGDASARIWHMNGPTAKSGCGNSRLLKHGNPTDKNKDVTTLEWSPDGNQLATGSYDGVARVWRRNGELVHTLRTHRGPIFSLKWNKRGNYLLSGSYDKTTIVWDVSGKNAFVKQQFDHHLAPALDVDWKDDHTFASCSTDKSVHICTVGAAQPIFTYTGHTDEVNAVKWDPSGTLLASCSDDCTAKVWDVNVNRNRNIPLYDFKSHKQEIYTVKWSPTGKGSPNPSKPPMLATASFDGTVRLWNIQNGSCIRILSRHRDSVYSVSFSPSGEYLASGSLAGQLYIWNVKDGKHVKSYKGEGDIFEVAWNKDETRVAACFSSNVVAVIDFKR